MGQAESKLEYAKEDSEHASYFDMYIASPVEQPALEAPTDVPIVVPTPPIDAIFPCCPGCKALNEPVTKLVPIKEDHPITLPCNNQGQATRLTTVHSSQHACHGGHSDHQGYRGVAHMQPSTVPRHKYPDQCEQEQSCLGQFTRFRLAGEQTNDEGSASNSSHTSEF